MYLMLAIIFLETSLELIPEEIAKHPAVLKDAKRRRKDPTKILLDDSKHHSAMKSLRDREKRGRPDIVHHCLLSLLDSRIEDLEIYVHTINNDIIWINRKTRLPRNYNRFVGLMESLFEKKIVKSNGDVLIHLKKFNISNLLESLSNRSLVLMTEYGDKDEMYLRSLIEKKKDLVICIGCFPHGDFSDEILLLMKRFNAEFVAIGSKPLTSLYVTNRVVCLYEGI